MNAIKPDYICGWKYKPEFNTADTTSLSDLYCTTTTGSDEYIAAEINRKIHEMYRRREIEMTSIKFNDLEKDLKELGIELSAIRHSPGECGCEIEGYFKPGAYKAHNARERLTPVHPVGPKPIPKKVIFSGPATTILWKDGTKTTVKCQRHDIWDDDVGIGMCYLKKMLGNEGNFNNIFREAMKVAEAQYKKEELGNERKEGE